MLLCAVLRELLLTISHQIRRIDVEILGVDKKDTEETLCVMINPMIRTYLCLVKLCPLTYSSCPNTL